MRTTKDSGIEWIGEIPSNWEIKRLCYLIDNYKAGPFGSSLIMDKLLDDGNILVYSPETIASGDIGLSSNKYLPDERRSEMQQFFVKPGDIIFPIVGSLGRAMLITNDLPCGIINQRLAKFSISSKSLRYDYFLWLFGKSSFYQTFIDLTCRGSIIVNLTKTILHDMPVPMPPTEEQKHIADFLDSKCAKIDALTADIHSQIDTLEQYKRSTITEAISLGLNRDTSYIGTDIPWLKKIPTHWKISKLKYEVFPIYRPIFDTDEIVTCFRDGQVTLRKARREDGFTISLSEDGYHGVEPGDLVIHGMDTFAGAIGCSDSRGKCSPVVHVCRTTGINRYYMYVLRSMAYTDVLWFYANGVRVRSSDFRNYSNLGRFSIAVPPIHEQNEIVEYLDAKCTEIDAIIADKQAQLATIEEYKKSLIYEHVTGKKEVPNQ